MGNVYLNAQQDNIQMGQVASVVHCSAMNVMALREINVCLVNMDWCCYMVNVLNIVLTTCLLRMGSVLIVVKYARCAQWCLLTVPSVILIITSMTIIAIRSVPMDTMAIPMVIALVAMLIVPHVMVLNHLIV